MKPTRVGVLALQGDFAEHAAMLRELGAEVVEVRSVRQLDGLSGLVLPGGESTTLLGLMQHDDWGDALRALHARGGVLFGTCAGAILLAREVRPGQPSLGLLDITVERNGYGRQADSFEAALRLGGEPLAAAFIRAPRIRAVGAGVDVLVRLDDEPVAVRQGRVLAATFHPELCAASGLHRLFLQMAGQASPAPRVSELAGAPA